MLKIAHVLYAGLGGVSDVCSVLGKIDNKIKSKSLFIQVGPKKFVKKISKLNQKTFFVKTFRFLSFFYFLPVLNIFIREKPNLIFLHNYQVIPCALFKIFFNDKLKIIYVDHTPNTLKNYKDFVICKFFKSIIDFFIALNNDSHNYFIKNIGLNPKKIQTIPNALNKYYLINSEKKESKNYFFTVGMAGRINRSKCQNLIIDAIQSNILKNFNIKCYFAGSGENIKFLKKKIKKKNQFKFFGSLDQKQLKKWYSKLDLYIQATRGEGHSTAILQAMGMNLPVIASNVTGIKKFLNSKKNIGIIFENKQKSLANKIKYCIRMSLKKKRVIIKSQKKFILNNYTESIFLENYKKIILKLSL